jgi:cytochrome P450
MRATLIEDFNALMDQRPGVERNEVFARLREHLPVFFSERMSAWVVARHADVRSVLSDSRFAPPKVGPGASMFGRSFLQMSGREHSKKVGIVAREMRSPRALKQRLEGLVEGIAARLVNDLPLGVPVDLRKAYASWLPLFAITELTGIHEATRFSSWYRALAAGGAPSISDPGAREAAAVARTELRAYLAPVIEERRRNPGRDLVSDLVRAQYDGAPLPDEEIVATVSFLLTAGVETTERVLTSALAHLLVDRAAWDDLRSHRHDADVLNAFSAESLRIYPPVTGSVREVLVPAELEGESLAVGDRILVLISAANRDPAKFAQAERFDRNRHAVRPERQFTASADILPFGAGEHLCTGSRLAQIEMLYGFSKFLDRIAWMEPVGEVPKGEGFFLHSPPSLPVILHGA